MLNTTPDGELLGIRVMWRIKTEYLGCQFTTLRVELNDNEIGRDISDRRTDKTADFIKEHLDCNREYRPRVRAVLSRMYGIIDNGIPLFYGGNSMISIHACTYTTMHLLKSHG